MRRLFCITVLICAAGLLFPGMKPLPPKDSFEPVAVIELFSSQGCSSCPPAESLLSKAISDARINKKNVLALSFHVDYWDRLGWKDPFSDKKFSERQNMYTNKLHLRSNYTPQMIVNGQRQFVGSDGEELESAISEALKVKPGATFTSLDLDFDAQDNPKVHYALNGNYSDCKIHIALLSVTEKTFVKKGENSGRSLVEEHVVRQLISKPASALGEAVFSASSAPAQGNILIIAYIQNMNNLKISGAAQIIPTNK